MFFKVFAEFEESGASRSICYSIRQNIQPFIRILRCSIHDFKIVLESASRIVLRAGSGEKDGCKLSAERFTAAVKYFSGLQFSVDKWFLIS